MEITKELILAVGEKDNCAFSCIFHEYFKKLMMYAYSFVNNYEDAEDIVQEVFMELPDLIKYNYEHEPNGFKSWLYTITKNKTLNYLKKRDRIKKISLEECFEFLTVQNSDSQASESIIFLDSLKGILTKEEHELLTYRYVLDYRLKEAQELMKLTANQAKKLSVSLLKKVKIYFQQKNKK